MGAPSARASELAYHWSRAGHQVSILTGFPNHPTGVVPAEWRDRFRHLVDHEKVGEVDVFRTWLWPLPNRKSHERMRNYASFCLSAALRDVPFHGRTSSLRLRRNSSLGSPDGGSASPGRYRLSLKSATFGRNRWLLSGSAAKTHCCTILYAQSLGFFTIAPTASSSSAQHSKISLLKTGALLLRKLPSSKTESRRICSGRLRRRLAAKQVGTSEVKVCGLLYRHDGNAHGLDTLLEAALPSNRESQCYVSSRRRRREKESIKDARSIPSPAERRFLDQQPREKIPAFISSSDACLVLLKKNEYSRR